MVGNVKGEFILKDGETEVRVDFDFYPDMRPKDSWNRHLAPAVASALKEFGVERGWKEMWWK